MALSLSLFGSFHVMCDGVAVKFATQAAQALLAYLAVEGDQPHGRDKLSALLWPDQPQAAAFTNLRQTVARVRRASPAVDCAIVHTRHTLQFLRDDATIDALQFEALIEACATHSHSDVAQCPSCVERLKHAVALYRGEFLHGLSLSGGQPFEEWLLFKREQFHRQALGALAALARHCEALADYEGMRDYAYQQLTLEPWREEAHAHLMRALAWAGQRTEAIAQYERCRRILQEELGIEPGSELRALVARIRDGDDVRASALALAAPTVHHTKHNLPAPTTAFIGREHECVSIVAQLKSGQARVLSLVGPGGMGKTRLALEVGRTLLDDLSTHSYLDQAVGATDSVAPTTAFPRLVRPTAIGASERNASVGQAFSDGVFFVSLAPLSAASAMPPATAAALGLSLQGDDPAQALSLALRDKRLLLILDNIEHLLSHSQASEMDDAARVVMDILTAAPHVQLLVTSRERLNVSGEHVHPVQGLDFDASLAANLEEAAASPAVKLFVQSARRAQPGFKLNHDNLPDVLRICRLVEGMPLALELAAAWLESLPLPAIVAEIEKSASFLAADWRDAPERQRSMRAVFEWSWRLLNEHERRAFCQLSIFRGGFTFHAAERVAGASLRALAGLIHKSLVRRTDGDGVQGRYGVHELLRQFAAEKLAAMNAGSAAALRARHGEYYLTLAGEKAAALYSGAPQRAAEGVQTDIDNLRQACEWALSPVNDSSVDDVQHKFKLLHDYAPSLNSIFVLLGLVQEGREWMRRCAELAQRASPASRTGTTDQPWVAALAAKSLVEQARCLATDNLYQQAALVAQRALSHARAAGDVDSEAGALLYWAESVIELGDVETGKRLLGQALELAQSAPPYHAPQPGRGTPVLQAMILTFLANGAITQGRFADAQRYGEQALRLCTEARDWLGQARVAGNLGVGYMIAGHYGQAMAHFEGALLAIRPFGNSVILIRLLQELGRVALFCGDEDSAEKHLREALAASQSLGDTLSEARAFGLLSRLARRRGDDRMAGELSERGAQLARDVGNQQMEADSLCDLGQALFELGQPDEASVIYRQALALYDALGHARITVEPRAGLARIALAKGNLRQAGELVEEILTALDQHPRTGLDEPFSAYLTCFHVLQRNGDRRAENVLRAAHALMQEYAEHVEDDALRQSFLNGVPEHRELGELCNAHLTEQRFDADDPALSARLIHGQDRRRVRPRLKLKPLG